MMFSNIESPFPMLWTSMHYSNTVQYKVNNMLNIIFHFTNNENTSDVIILT